MPMRGETVYVDGTTAVDDVLVHIGEFERNQYHAIEISKPVGTNVAYTLYFPMSYTDDLTGHHITVRGYDCAVLGHPDHERPAQVFGSWLGRWDMQVKVERTLAEYLDAVEIVRTTVTRDSLGNRTTSETVLYAGGIQARKSDGQEKGDSAGIRDTETWYFILPYQPALAGIPSQQLSIRYAGGTWDVLDITDVDNAHETHSIKATCLDLAFSDADTDTDSDTDTDTE